MKNQRHQTLRDCERALEAQRPNHQQAQDGEIWICPCGRRFEHVCDEAEGCRWDVEPPAAEQHATTPQRRAIHQDASTPDPELPNDPHTTCMCDHAKQLHSIFGCLTCAREREQECLQFVSKTVAAALIGKIR